jgi:MtN3 and saliva related transmembrane protein
MVANETYPRISSRKWVVRYEAAMVVIGVLGPFATVPQLSKLYFTHSQHALGQSVTTWALYSVLSLQWLVYGLAEKKPAIYLALFQHHSNVLF